jgi:hypothetical protein
MIGALLYLQFHSVVNRLAMRLKRLKQPKYMVGGIVGAIYFYFYFFRYVFGLGGRRQGVPMVMSPESSALWENIGALILFIILLLAWVVPHQRAALAFTEAEVAFLFPAPVSRRGLIHFKLIRSQTAILFTTILLMLVTRRLGGNVWIHVLGWWVILSTLNLHLLASSFGRTMLLERGISNWLRRLVILGGALVLAITAFAWAARTMPGFHIEEMNTPEAMRDYLRQVFMAGPLPYMLYPFRLVVKPYFAPNSMAFLLALLPALALLLAHYVWVIRSNVAFEEASVEASKKLAEKVAAIRAGRMQVGQGKRKKRRAPFTLGPVGPPSVALLWKNLLSAGQAFSLRFWILLAVIGISISMVVSQSSARADLGTAIGLICAGFVVWSLIVGPQVMRQDFRQDLPLADVLKMYPLRGWQVALGELLAPAVILTAIQWCLLLVTMVLLFQSKLPELGGMGIVAIGLGAAPTLPMLNLIILQIPNAAVLLFPSWFQTGKDGPQGIEATGQRLISLLGQLVAFFIALIPASIVFVIVLLLARMVLARMAFGVAAAISLGLVSASLVLAGEAAFGLLLVGWLFERLDLSAETNA